MNEQIPEGAGRISIGVNEAITLNLVNNENETRTFRILEVLGSGGTAIAYKVEYEGADNNRYLYVLKEIYPVPTDGSPAIERHVNSLNIDQYEEQAQTNNSYMIYRKQFEAAYRIQNEMATGEEAVACMTTSLPIGLYEDRSSSHNGNYAIYGLFQYIVGHTLKMHEESSLMELVDIQRKIAEVVKTYHDHGYLWLDIKEANVNVVGAGTVQSISMFDFGSLVLKDKLMNYDARSNPDFVLSFSPTSTDLLLPKELESMLSTKRIGGFAFVDVRKHETMIQVLGEYGAQADIFLLGSLLFKRLMGRAPTKDDCEKLQKGSFDMSSFDKLIGFSSKVMEKTKGILVNCLNYENRNKRYSTVSAYMADLNELYLELCTHEGLSIVEGNARRYVTLCCNQYLNNILSGDTDGKFRHLKQLQGRFESRVSLRSDSSKKQVLPSVAIDSAPRLNDGESNNRLVFLYGDGGMGKSTALYDYMCETASVTAIYIELNQYEFISRDKSFIFKKIFEDICNKFIDVAGFINQEELSRVEDILMASLRVPDSNDPRPQYVLLLDGYNEISREFRGGFDVEIAKIIDTWKNCRIVITGRNLPTDSEGKEIPVYKHFSRFEFIGISEEERKSLIEAKYPERASKIQKDKRLWGVLRIPMFMGMFIQFDSNLFDRGQTVSIHTRGEILDQFIMKTEKDAASRIAEKQSNHSGIRNLIMQLSLPYAANDMDRRRSFSAFEAAVISQVTNSNSLYLVSTAGENRISVYESYTKKLVSADNIGFTLKKYTDLLINSKLNLSKEQVMQCFISGDDISHIIKVETGYCYDTSDGKIAFTHQYFRDYFAAKHIQNVLNTAQALGENGLSQDEQRQFTNAQGLDYTWSDDVCVLLGEIIGDYKNEPGYTEE